MADPPGKPYTVAFTPRTQYLYALVIADTISADLALAYCGEVAEMCRRLGFDRLMIHRAIPAMLPEGPLFFVAVEVAALVQGIKTAFVNPYRRMEDLVDFAITVGENRGADLGHFNNDQDAEKWLLR